MSRNQIIRAWKDPQYRRVLSAAEREQLPAHPAGAIELSTEDLSVIAGGAMGKFTPHCTEGNTCDVCTG